MINSSDSGLREAGSTLIAAREMLPQIRSMYGSGKPILITPSTMVSASAQDSVAMSLRGVPACGRQETTEAISQDSENREIAALPSVARNDKRRIAAPFEGGEEPEDGLEEPEEAAALLGQWLQFYGPVTMKFIQKTLGIEEERLQLALEDLIDSQKVIQGRLVTEGEPDEICDSDEF